MWRRIAFMLMGWCFMATRIASGELPDEVIRLARVRRQAAHDLSRIPNYTCLETVERTGATSTKSEFHRQDLIRLEVAEVNHRELFAWPGQKNFGSQNIHEMIAGGLTSTGEFIDHARSIFAGGSTRFNFGGNELLHGRPAIRYDYSLAAAFSNYQILARGDGATVAMHGSFWAQADSLGLERLTVIADEIPLRLGLRSAVTTVDYSPVVINEQRYVLPQSAQVSVLNLNGSVDRNLVVFTHCRQYQAESVLRFESAEDKPSQPAPAQLDESPLPKGVKLRVTLAAPLDSKEANVGDAITADVREDPVSRSGRMRQSGKLEGRIRALEPVKEGVMLEIEFERMRFEGRNPPFWALLQNTSSVSSLKIDVSNPKKTAQVPGVGRLLIHAPTFVLPSGFTMRWVSVAP